MAITWSDVGVVLSSRKQGENFKIVNILTRNHGKSSGLVRIVGRNNFSVFSKVDVDLIMKSENSLGFWHKRTEKQNWARILHSDINVSVFQSICLVLDKILPHGSRYCRIYEFLEYLTENTGLNNDCMTNLYAFFELMLLKETGFGFDFSKCSMCGRQEELFFISPSTGRTASKECAYQYRDKLLVIPDIWKDWNNASSYEEIAHINISKADLRNSLYITWYFICKHMGPINNYFRSHIISERAKCA
ncbi:MAG: DNA repair protein RecO [Holosporales bacterium]|nr:DNA repair protein RecO [Holosporales bacterium]